jgi:thioredoxin 1
MNSYQAQARPEPTREEIDTSTGDVLLEFGAQWCPHCHGVQGALQTWLARYPNVRHIKVEDGRGKPLGRSFRVKLWPTLIFLRDGKVIEQYVRPDLDQIRTGFENFVRPTSEPPSA